MSASGAEYLKQHRVDEVAKGLVATLVQQRPHDPLAALLGLLQARNRAANADAKPVGGDAEGAASATDDGAGGAHNQLSFDFDMPESAGETFTAAVLLMCEDEQVADHADGLAVRLTATLDGESVVIDGAEEPSELGCGEALFSDIHIGGAAAAGGKLVLRAALIKANLHAALPGGRATKDAVKSFDLAASVAGAAGDEQLTDVAVITSKLKAQGARGPKTKLYLTLLKARLWNADANAMKLKECEALEAVVGLLADGAATDESVEALNVVEELLRNPAGHVLRSCAACKAIMREGGFSVAPSGHCFHPGCLFCIACKKPFGERDSSFVRNADFRPFHAACLAADQVNGDAQQVTPLPAPASGAECVAFAHFRTTVAPALVTALEGHRKDAYVVDRVKSLRSRAADGVALVPALVPLLSWA